MGSGRSLRAAETLSFSVLPGDVRTVGPAGTQSARAVQPDGRLKSDRTAVWLEAKRIRPSSVQERQLARTLAALLSNARDLAPLLLLVLGAPPPVQVQRQGRVRVAEAVEHPLPHLGPAVDRHRVRDAVESVRWITWDEVDRAIADVAAGYANADRSTLAAAAMALGALQAGAGVAQNERPRLGLPCQPTTTVALTG